MRILTDAQYQQIELFLHSLLALNRKNQFTSKQVKDETRKVIEVLYRSDKLIFRGETE